MTATNASHDPVPELLKALCYAAQKHSAQRRKDSAASPYINHPIAVAELLARVAGRTDLTLLQAAILHDVLEDTPTPPAELDELFGPEVRKLVQEVTDNKDLPKAERKRLQVEHAPHLSTGAKQIKIADKICNLMDINATEPARWSLEEKLQYLNWAQEVIAGCRGVNNKLEQHFDGLCREKARALNTGS